ncbi:MAG: flagellar filament capping protein FliD [Glaciimonas sp.]|nr:flagellar filament capping protein FliD [Glaciimonas sp.]
MGIQSTGIGSGLDVTTLITKLMQVESQPLTALATKEASFQAKLSAYGTLNSAVSGFQSALTSLSKPTTFQSLSGTSSDATIASASASSAASAGSYSITVTKLAQAQGISSIGKVSSTDAIGDGVATTLTFQFGTIVGTIDTATTTPGPPPLPNPNLGKYQAGATFTQDANQTTGTVTIDSKNNSLQGIRDAVNAANVGVSASIVGDGSATPYHLVLNSSKTGLASSLKITGTGGDGAVTNLVGNDPAGVQNFTEVTAAQNAELKINGINITSAANSVSGAIQGVSINLTKVGTTSVSVSANTSAIQTGVTSFVKAYNDLNTTIKSLSGYNASTKKGGLLLGDSTTQGIQNQIRNTLSTAVNGLGGGFTNLTQIGVSFQKDGSLTLDAEKLTAALSTNYSDVGGLFASIGKASDSLISIAGSSSATKPGSYALVVNQVSTQGILTGNSPPAEPITIALNTTLSVTLDGINASVSLAAGTSYTRAQLATLLQTSINGNTAFSSAGSSIVASIDGNNNLVLKSNKYGSTSSISIANGSSGTTASSLIGSAPILSNGVNVAGTLNGISAIGSGQTLTGAKGTDAEGLQLLVAGGTQTARGTINFSRGYAFQLDKLLSGFVGSSGTISSSTTGVNNSIKEIGKQRVTLNNRLFDIEARYRAQFTALDKVISSLNNTSTFLTQQLAALSGTTKF